MTTSNVPFASPGDVEVVWGTPLTETQILMTEARLRQASAIIREEVRTVGGLTVDERVAASSSFAELTRGVARDMVLRLLMNPKGRRDVAIDDSRVTYDSAISTGQLYLSDIEYRALIGGRALAVSGGAGAFTIRPYHEPDVAYSGLTPDRWFQSWEH